MKPAMLSGKQKTLKICQVGWLLSLALTLTLSGCSQNKPSDNNLKASGPLKYLVTLQVNSLLNDDQKKNLFPGILRWNKQVRYQTYFATPYKFSTEQNALIFKSYGKLRALTGLDIQKVDNWKKTNTALLFANDWRFEIAYKAKWYKEGNPELAKMSDKEFIDYLYSQTTESKQIIRSENGFLSHYFLISNFVNPKDYCYLQNALLEGLVPDNNAEKSPLNRTVFNYRNECDMGHYFPIDKALLVSFYSPKLESFFGENLSTEQMKIFKQKLIDLTVDYIQEHHYAPAILDSNVDLLKGS
ncbi:hypothetical protein [Hydrogenovibrio sp. JE_KL2]|uniref:hypothetical protein n=1 Tax=Hydrogenovibrio sp. JE_KL2 TaxID=2651188 RepID=UPI00128D2280|nr:hypothetical protein [Hydrogenovibrio sp. JE_KL2]MPQ76481.1 hypothetical protein [Hydrogenovibrio sp. JE_KL2]